MRSNQQTRRYPPTPHQGWEKCVFRTVQAAASLLYPSQRDGFVRSVVNHWAQDRNFNHVIRLVLSGHGAPAGASVYERR
jgi:hypothetical protein